MTLLAWLHRRLGYADNHELLADLCQVDEGFDADGRSHALARLASRASRFHGIATADLERYDSNIREALAAINAGRAIQFTLRYFQYLAALYTEMFLDLRFNEPAALLASLNGFVHDRNISRTPSEPRYNGFTASDLDKLAFWMATGSGKTLLLHLNYHQFLNYIREPLDNILLVTPNEGLSEQHLAEMTESNIPCRRFNLEGRQIGVHTVHVTEITKLVIEKRGEGRSVPIEAFEGNNLIFVDEGHMGSGGETWRQVRDAIGATGFTFEYSATFGQALNAARNDTLTAEYGKAIAFDYSYHHFYNDGHGKDFSIINLLKDPGEHTDTLLLANLISLHEQHIAFRTHPAAMRRYGLEQPLWALVGASVNAVYSQKKRKRSDVLTAIRFLHRVLTEPAWATASIGRLLDGRSGLDGRQGDLFHSRFGSLMGQGSDAIYSDLLRYTLHAHSGGGLRLCDIAGAEGELGLKVAGSEHYFGLVYIGDTAAFKKLVQADDAGITIERDAISGSLFEGINRPGTTIEILIGARKFLEGWNSWRVSSMGLLNIGRSEGAQIIQMFGRGVRLKGAGMSLKRSSALPGNHPSSLRLLETLNIFALRASYMARFREYLEREGVTVEERFEVHLPIRTNPQWRGKDLVVPRLDEERDFSREVKHILVRGEGAVALNWGGRAQVVTSGHSFETVDASSGGDIDLTRVLDLVDWNAAYLAVARHVTERGCRNLAVDPNGLRKIVEDPSAYALVGPEYLANPATLLDMDSLQQVVVAILCKWVDRQHRNQRTRWESRHTRYQLLDDEDPNLQFNFEIGEPRAKYIVSVPQGQAEIAQEVERLANTDALYDSDADMPPRIHFDRHLYQPLLIERAGRQTGEIRTFPPSLNASERTFVEDLRDYWDERQASSPDQTEIFLLRNLSRGRGVGFFEESGFYPDFILWIKDGSAQRIVFIEPHGMMNARAYARDDKAQLHSRLPALAESMTLPPNVSRVTLDSFIVSATPFQDLQPRYDDGSWTRDRFAEKHILFQEDRRASEFDYIAAML